MLIGGPGSPVAAVQNARASPPIWGHQGMPSPIRSRSLCPLCGRPLYYVSTLFTFLTGLRKRVCTAPDCAFKDARRFRVASRRTHADFLADGG